MSSEDSTESRQNNEFAVLEAIYGSDLTDLRGKSAWNKWKPLNFKISLTPLQGSKGPQEVYVKADLRIICDMNYPNNVPQIHLENSKGLSQALLAQLQTELKNKAELYKGEEMVFQLAQYVQEFLHLHNKPLSKSLYDQMLQRKKEKEEKDLQAKLMEEDRKRQHIQQEVKRRQEMLKSESRLWHRNNSETSNDNDTENAGQSLYTSESSDDQICDHKTMRVIEFNNKSIKIGQCLKHCSWNHVVFIGMDERNGEIVLLSEWKIKNTKQVASLEQEFNYLSKLKHPNLVQYLNYKFEQISDVDSIVYIVKEFVYGPNCSFFLNENFNASIQLIKCISKGVLTALDYLHRNNVVHKDVKDNCVYINSRGQILLANYSLHRRLADISTQNNNCGNYSKKSDIYKFGKFLVMLLQGSTFEDSEEIDIPTTIPVDLHEFISKCLEKQEKERWTATQLLKHPFLHHNVAIASPAHKIQHHPDDGKDSPEMTTNEIAALQQSGQSRLEQEFEFIHNLGKGAFGDVIKAKNNLDGRYYAVKRIKLNPKNKQLNKKIVREVKLLSRLNHENIVRYYNSWIERTVIKSDDVSDWEMSTPTFNEKLPPKVVHKDEFTINDNIEELAPSMKSVEVSVTYDSNSKANFNQSSDESEDDDVWGGYTTEFESDGIEFEAVSSTKNCSKEEPSSARRSVVKTSPVENVRQIEFMYIQMEFCEKSTLRNAIDNSVYLEEDRVWRLFREIMEGLVHIHQQGMIHRDLKPVNIFLDSNDHVKIGDFGLATNMKTILNESHLIAHQNDYAMDESKTGLIGTALYVAPELGVASKAKYNQKVDIYSLGIIFFEMCYRPLPTEMERYKILTTLRKNEATLPEDFTNSKQKFLVKWLLNHDVSKRPTSLELLQSEHIPPPVLEERELRELVRHTLSNPQLKGYKYLIASCFDQVLTPAQDITYDKDPAVNKNKINSRLYDFVKGNIIKHGGHNLPTPLLMPRSKYYDSIESCVKLMTHFGGIVTLPHDLRVPFARYIAWNGIGLLRRFSIEKVYREKKVFGFLPRELYECAFDIVTPTPGALIVDGEALYIVYEILNSLPALKTKQITIRLNHPGLTKGLLLHCGIKSKHQEVFSKIWDVKEGKISKNDLQTYLTSFGLSDNSISTLTNIFNSEFDISKAANQLQHITRRKSNEAGNFAKQALQDLKTIAQHAEAFGVTYEMVVAPGMVYNIEQYSGMMCQFVCELKKKHNNGIKEVLAAGGRYDSLITFYRKMMESGNMPGKEIRQSAVGISLSLDKLVQAIIREGSDDLPNFERLAVCSVGSKPLLKEKTKILHDLWTAGIPSVLIETTNIEEIQEQCAELNTSHVVMLKDGEHGIVRVRSLERERFQEKTFKTSDLVENIQRLLRNWKEGSQDSPTVAGALSKSESKTSYTESHEVNVSVLFVTVEKLSANTRKRYDLQIRSNLDALFKQLNGTVTVLALNLESDVIRTISSYIEWENESQFHKSSEIILEKHQRHKKYLSDICDEIFEQKSKKTKPIIVLFSLLDSFHRLLI